MTGTDVGVETLAHRIAARGQDTLTERLRIAYGDAAAAHADLISLDPEQIEAMVQAAAGRADGLQWRRALADVASGELGISVTEALTHPAVVRAQALVGAPSYEQSLAEMIARPVPPPAPRAVAAQHAGTSNGSVSAHAVPEPEPPQPEPVPAPPAHEPMPGPPVREPVPGPAEAASEATPPTAEHQLTPAMQAPADEEPGTADERRADELEMVEADDVVLELLPEPDPIEYETEVYDVEASFTQDEAPRTAGPEPFAAERAGAPAEQPAAIAAPTPTETPAGAEPPLDPEEPEDTELVMSAIHLGGVANLPTKREGLGVRLSGDGLDILQGERDIIGRLVWEEIETLEVPHLRARRRRSEPRARLVVRTPHGDASFEVPGISADELRDRVEPFARRFGHN